MPSTMRAQVTLGLANVLSAFVSTLRFMAPWVEFDLFGAWICISGHRPTKPQCFTPVGKGTDLRVCEQCPNAEMR